MPMQVVNGGEGMELFVYFKIVKLIVSIKTRDLVVPMTKVR
jgi:hypothetical protein